MNPRAREVALRAQTRRGSLGGSELGLLCAHGARRRCLVALSCRCASRSIVEPYAAARAASPLVDLARDAAAAFARDRHERDAEHMARLVDP